MAHSFGQCVDRATVLPGELFDPHFCGAILFRSVPALGEQKSRIEAAVSPLLFFMLSHFFENHFPSSQHASLGTSEVLQCLLCCVVFRFRLFGDSS